MRRAARSSIRTSRRSAGKYSATPRRKWPFSDPATFLGTAFRPDAAALPGFGGLDVVGGDVVEVAPQYDATTNTAQIAAQALFELLCLVAGSRRERQRGKT